METYKIVLIGEQNTGKSTYVHRIRTGEYKKTYAATLGVEVHPIKVNTTVGMMTLNFWDCAGKPEFEGLGEGYYIGADGFLIFYHNHSQPASEKQKYLKKAFPNIPALIYRTKIDMLHENDPNVHHSEISTKTCHNLDDPLVQIIRRIKNDNSIELIETPNAEPAAASAI